MGERRTLMSKGESANGDGSSPKEVMDRIAREVMNGRNLAVIDEVAAEDFVEHDPPPGQGPGREGFKRFLAEELFVGFPDLRWEIEEQIAGGEKLVSRFTWYGTHEGAFLGLPPTGKRVAVKGVVIDRVVGGRWTESRILMDNLGMMMQLGAIPPPPQPTEA